MGKLIVNEQDVKRIVDESTNKETGIINQFVNREIRAEVNKLHLDMNDYDLKYTKKNQEINEAIANLLERISVLEKQKSDNTDIVSVINPKIKPSKSDDILDFRSLCRTLNIPYFTPTKLKYYLYEQGIYDMKINEIQNSYLLKASFDEFVDKELVNCIHISKKKLTFSKDIITYFEKNKDKVRESILRYEKKNKEYKLSKKNISVKRVEDYKEEIKRICGLDSPAKWTPLYKEFSKTFPNFYSNWEKADKKFKENNPKHPDWNYPKVDFIVNDMQQGDVLLKIACQLYVD